MKLFKKILTSCLVLTALFASIPNTTYANSERCERGHIYFHHWESGTVVVNSGNHAIYNEHGQPLTQYYPGESFYYDRVYSSTSSIGEHFFASYLVNGNVRCVQTCVVNSLGKKTYVKGLTIY